MSTIRELEAACQHAEPIASSDAVLASMKFPFVRRFYPLGFPVDLCSNSMEVLEVAAAAWGKFNGLFHTDPIKIQVGVLQGNAMGCPPAPICRVQRHLLSFVADCDNFGTNDLSGGFSSIWLTEAAVRNHNYMRYFFLDCAAFSQITTRCATGIHAGCVSKNDIGILLCGDSGAGKSTLSYACAKAGWTYTTDDGSYLVHDREELIVVGNCYQVRFRPETSSIFPEIEGRPVTHRAEIGKPSVELETSDLDGILSSQTAKAACIVFLNRREGKNEPLRPYSKNVAREFLRQGRFSPPEFMPRHLEIIERLLSTEVLELRYRDLDWAIEQLNLLVESRHS